MPFAAIWLERIQDNHAFSSGVHDYFHGIVNPAGFDQIIADLFINNIYPNPANNYSILDISNFKDGGNVIINDINGRVVQDIKFNAGQKTIKINTSILPEAIYFYKIVNDEISTDGKILEVIH